MRAFIQLGGFTFGKTASFYDFFNTSKYSLQSNFIYQDFAGVGIFTYGYTQQLGNGVAVTIAGQDPSPFESNIVDVASSTSAKAFSNMFLISAPAANNFADAGTLVPDIVGAIRVDQAWGGAQIAAIAHDNRVNYYSSGAGGTTGAGIASLSGVGHPDDKWGWAVMGGLETQPALVRSRR